MEVPAPMGSSRTDDGAIDGAAGEGSDESPDVVLSARGLRKSYGSGRQQVEVLRGIDLDIPQGQMLGIIGPSGSGKSTLLHVLSGLDDLPEGKVLLNGRSLHDLGDNELASLRARSLGFVLQQNNFIPSLTIEENVAAPLVLAGEKRAVAIERAREELGNVGVADRGRAWPGEASIGELQRAALARACVSDPLVVFGDEPTGALDTENRGVVLGLLTKLTRGAGAAAVIVTHDPVVAAACDRVVRMSNGTLEEQPLEELPT
jgi:predicted ABC-type transport system involved in lysophospholipase L1 biosynthesis ATPase subunit